MGALLTQFMNKYAYTDFHELNADWMIRTMMELINQVENFVSLNAIKYADPIQWDITRQYEKNTVVIDPLTGTAYISVQPVPMGVALTNTDYWTVVFDLGSFVVRAAKNFSNRYEAETTLTATFPSSVDDWLVWGDTLYVVISNIVAGDQYVINSNIKRITMEEVCDALAQAIDTLDTKVGYLNDLNTTDKSSIVNAINEVLDDVGDITNLNTTDKTNIVNAINEVNSKWVTPQMYGAVGDGVTDDYQAFVDCFANNNVIFIPDGSYLINNVTALSLHSNMLLIFSKNAKLIATVDTDRLLYGHLIHDVTIIGGIFEGTNTYDASDGLEGIYFSDCYNLIVDGIEIYDFSRVALSYSGCSYSKIVNCNLHHNAHYGIRIYADSHDVIVSNNCSYNNGVVHSGLGSVNGRGIQIAKCENVTIANNICHDNNEYGIRLYEDTSLNKGCYNIVVNSNQSYDNGKNNFLIYSESDHHKNIVVTNNYFGDVTDAAGTCVSLRGDNVKFDGNTLVCSKLAVNLVSMNGSISNNNIDSAVTAFSFGSTDAIINMTNNTINAQQFGSINAHYDGSVFDGNKITCNVDSTGQNYYGIILDHCGVTVINNVIKGFARNIIFNLDSITGTSIIRDNVLIDATGTQLYAYSEIDEHIIICRNTFKGTANKANKFYYAGMIDCGDNALVPARLLRLNQAPTSGNWNVGDMVINVSPTNDLASVLAWVCTTAGSPGTWRSLTSPT